MTLILLLVTCDQESEFVLHFTVDRVFILYLYLSG